MAQIVYLGLDSDFTQEIGLMASRIGSKARVVEGLGASVIDGAQSQVLLQLQPGLYVMPDGMVVKETEVVKIPLSGLSPNQPGYTLYAKRYEQDAVYYDVAAGLMYADTLSTSLNDSDPNMVCMPLAFIFVQSSNLIANTGSAAAQYSVTNLGVRGQVTYTRLMAPFSGLYQVGYPQITTFSPDGFLLNQLQPSLPSNPLLSYIQVSAPDNQFLAKATFVGRKNRATNAPPSPISLSLKVTSQYLSSQPSFLNVATQIMTYQDPDLLPRPLLYQTFSYPAGSNISQDLLTIEVINTNSINNRVSTIPFELSQIILSTLGIFG